MRKKGGLTLIAFVVIAVGLFLATVLAGNRPVLGLDLQGGVSVVLQPKPAAGQSKESITPEALEQTKSIIEKRVNAIGVGEPDITIQGQTIVVQLPGIEDQRRALSLVGETAELRFRPVLEDLGRQLGKDDLKKIDSLRAELKIPEGVTAQQVYDAEQTARGLPTIEQQRQQAQALQDAQAATPTTAPAAPPASVSSVPAGEGTGGGRSAKVFRLRAQTSAPPTTTTPAAATSTTVPPTTTTTTIDPAPKNEWGIAVYKDPQANLEDKFQQLLQLELQKAQGDTQLTKPEDDDPKKEVILADADGQRYRLGPSELTGQAVESAEAGINQQGQWEVRPTFREGSPGIDDFNKIAAVCNAGGPTCPTLSGREHGALAVVLDSEVLTAPSINEPSYTRNQITISGSFDEQKAKDVALALRYGSLPLVLEPQQVQTVSATLGEGALKAALIAGLIGLALVAAWMIFYYRILGLVTIGALTLSAMLLWSIISFFGETAGLTLTLAGIVGIIVSIGVSLDSSVVYFENLKEDVRSGRTLRSTVSRSFDTAFSTTVKADVSSLIGAVVLYLLSIGPVRGFAFYLGVSTLLDLFTSYFFTRPAVALLGRSRLSDRPSLFGIPTDDLPAARTQAVAAGVSEGSAAR